MRMHRAHQLSLAGGDGELPLRAAEASIVDALRRRPCHLSPPSKTSHRPQHAPTRERRGSHHGPADNADAVRQEGPHLARELHRLLQEACGGKEHTRARVSLHTTSQRTRPPRQARMWCQGGSWCVCLCACVGEHWISGRRQQAGPAQHLAPQLADPAWRSPAGAPWTAACRCSPAGRCIWGRGQVGWVEQSPDSRPNCSEEWPREPRRRQAQLCNIPMESAAATALPPPHPLHAAPRSQEGEEHQPGAAVLEGRPVPG